MIHTLQHAINKNFNQRLLVDKVQFYSTNNDRPITQYVLKLEVWDEGKQKFKKQELFASTSMIQIVLFLRDYWYELNGWEVPTDNEMWNKAKEKYMEKKQPNDINPIMKGSNRRGRKNKASKYK